MIADHLYSLFFILAIVFACLVWRDYRQNLAKLTPAAKVRLRMACIFAFIGLVLAVEQNIR